jgi:hypothetical protein
VAMILGAVFGFVSQIWANSMTSEKSA